jgi:uridine kinase
LQAQLGLADVNFDHPDALDFPLLSRHLAQLKSGRGIDVPVYDFVTHKRLIQTEPFAVCPVIVLDGTLILSQPAICAHLDVSVFIDTPETLRLSRRMRRDTHERGRTAEGVMKQFTRQVKPMHDRFVEPSKGAATHVISGEIPFERDIEKWAKVLSPTMV